MLIRGKILKALLISPARVEIFGVGALAGGLGRPAAAAAGGDLEELLGHGFHELFHAEAGFG